MPTPVGLKLEQSKAARHSREQTSTQKRPPPLIHPIRKLAREVHRRSVWQVLGMYLVLGWVTLEGIRWATVRIGLPEWTPTMALVLMGLLLPVTIATAVVQGGLPGLRMVDAVDPNELEGLTPEQVHVIPEAHPLYRKGILTWRNSVLLGVMSAALLCTSVVAYLTMWALGIGPVGSLLAQGLVEESGAVLVAEFQNRTDEMGLSEALTAALEADLGESALLTVFDSERRAAALTRMGRSPDEAVTPAVARRLAQAEGIPALVEGDVARVGRGYRISVRIVLWPGTSAVSQFRETVADHDELVPALDLLSERVRAKFGESLRVIRAGTPLVELYGPTVGLSDG